MDRAAGTVGKSTDTAVRREKKEGHCHSARERSETGGSSTAINASLSLAFVS
jgi:hypothetical protein